MSLSKYRFHSLVPRRDDRSVLPATLAGALVMLAVAQMLLVQPAELPVGATPVAPGARFAPPAVAARLVDPAILARPLFAPRRPAVTGGVGTVPNGLDGVQVAGTIARGGRRFVVVRRPDGKIVNLSNGQTSGNWQLVAIGDSAAVFASGGQRVTIPYSATAATPAAEGESADQ